MSHILSFQSFVLLRTIDDRVNSCLPYFMFAFVNTAGQVTNSPISDPVGFGKEHLSLELCCLFLTVFGICV